MAIVLKDIITALTEKFGGEGSDETQPEGSTVEQPAQEVQQTQTPQHETQSELEKLKKEIETLKAVNQRLISNRPVAQTSNDLDEMLHDFLTGNKGGNTDGITSV